MGAGSSDASSQGALTSQELFPAAGGGFPLVASSQGCLLPVTAALQLLHAIFEIVRLHAESRFGRPARSFPVKGRSRPRVACVCVEIGCLFECFVFCLIWFE